MTEIIKHLQCKAFVEKANGLLTVVASDETVDRSGESIPISSWDLTNFQKSPRLLIDHDYSVKSIVGVADNIRTQDGKLMFEPRFHEITDAARECKALVEQGFLDTVSVGFISRMKDGKVTNELLEVSFVAVPCNPNARTMALEEELAVKSFMKDAGVEEVKPEEKPVEEPSKPEEKPENAGEEPVGEGSGEEPQEAVEKGLVYDTLEAASEIRSQKYSIMDPIVYAFWDFVDAFMLDSTPIESLSALCEDYKATMTQLMTAGVQMEKQEKPLVKAMAVWSMKTYQEMTKSGRVLSDANRTIIQNAIAQMNEANSALQTLLDATDPQGTEEKAQDGKGAPKQRSSGAGFDDEAQLKSWLLMRRALRAVNSATSEVLAKSKITLKK
ncbi:MAG: hypothetical protein WCV84_04610 [Patescibacteria group bacterium]